MPTEMPNLTYSIEKLADALYKISITQNFYPVGPCTITVFDRDMRCRSILLGGDLLTDGVPEDSMIEMSLDNVTYSKVCGHRQAFKIPHGIDPGETVEVYMRINKPEGMNISGEVLNVVIIPSEPVTLI